MIKVLISPVLQITLALVFFLAAVGIVTCGYVLHLRDNVSYVSLLSELALIYAAWAGVITALVLWDANHGHALNPADFDRLEKQS